MLQVHAKITVTVIVKVNYLNGKTIPTNMALKRGDKISCKLPIKICFALSQQ